MFGFKSRVAKKLEHMEKRLQQRCVDNTEAWAITHNEVLKLEKELHGWQSAMYSLMNALQLDLSKDDNGNIVITKRVNENLTEVYMTSLGGAVVKGTAGGSGGAGKDKPKKNRSKK